MEEGQRDERWESEEMTVIEEAQAQSQLWKTIYSFAESQAVRCAVQLHVADIINSHGSPTPISHLAAQVPVPCSPERLHRFMGFLDHMGLFEQHKIEAHHCELQEDQKVAVLEDHHAAVLYEYSLTPLSAQLLVSEADHNLVPMVSVDLGVLMHPWHHMKESLEESGANINTFKSLFGVEFWEFAESNLRFGERLNEVMACDTRVTMAAILEQWKVVFEGVDSLVDVGGGTGTAAAAIAEAFTAINCTVFDNAHVVNTGPERAGVKHVAGDMFTSIPRADALLLKWILHNYGDEDCMKILNNCKEALPTKGGKIIIVEIVMDDGTGQEDEFSRATHALDLEMMLLFGGKERTEEEWRRLLHSAGFTKCNIMPIKSTIHSLIEASM